MSGPFYSTFLIRYRNMTALTTWPTLDLFPWISETLLPSHSRWNAINPLVTSQIFASYCVATSVLTRHLTSITACTQPPGKWNIFAYETGGLFLLCVFLSFSLVKLGSETSLYFIQFVLVVIDVLCILSAGRVWVSNIFGTLFVATTILLGI